MRLVHDLAHLLQLAVIRIISTESETGRPFIQASWTESREGRLAGPGQTSRARPTGERKASLVSQLPCLSLLVVVGRRRKGAGPRSPRALAGTPRGLLGRLMPVPPAYEYGAFLSWLRRTDVSRGFAGVPMAPQVSWFDVDAAVSSHPAWFEGEDMTAVATAVKDVNRFEFMKGIMLSGDDAAQSSLAIHLYILQKLLPTARPGARFLDAGCGTGFLLQAWMLLAGEGSHAVGLDMDPAEVAEARQNVACPASLSAKARRPSGARCSVFLGDALRPDPAGLGLAPCSVDAISLGVAVREAADLAPLGALLREGGLLAAPVCSSPCQDEQVLLTSSGCQKTPGRFTLFRRDCAGGLVEVPGQNPVKVHFIVAR